MVESRKGTRVGELNPKVVLNEDKVREIRRLYSTGDFTMKQLGTRFGVSKSAIMFVVTRRSWKHVE